MIEILFGLFFVWCVYLVVCVLADRYVPFMKAFAGMILNMLARVGALFMSPAQTKSLRKKLSKRRSLTGVYLLLSEQLIRLIPAFISWLVRRIRDPRTRKPTLAVLGAAAVAILLLCAIDGSTSADELPPTQQSEPHEHMPVRLFPARIRQISVCGSRIW